MSVQSTTARIVRVVRELTGIRTVFDRIPRRIQSAHLPAVVVLALESQYSTAEYGEEMIGKPRTYRVFVYAEDADFGSEGEFQGLTEQLIESVSNHLIERPGLAVMGEAADQETVFNSEVLGDAGLKIIPYPPNAQDAPEYLGTWVDVQVEEVSAISYKDGRSS